MTRLLAPPPLFGYAVAPIFIFSPDGKYFVTVVRRGSTEDGVNDYRLLLFHADDVNAYLSADNDASMPGYRVLVNQKTASDRDAIEQIVWQPSGRQVCFLGRNRLGTGRVFSVDIQTGTVIGLTDENVDVAAYDFSESSREIVYSAYSAPDWEGRNARGYTVQNFYPTLFLGARNPGDVAELYLRYYIRNVDTGGVTAVRTSDDWIAPGAGGRDIAVSGTRHAAIISKTVQRIPMHWREYDGIKNEPILGTSTDGHLELDDTFGMPDFSRVQYHVVDLRNGNVRPLIDAPSEGGFAGWSIPPKWSPDGTYVLLPRSYLPQRTAKDMTAAFAVKPVVVASPISGQTWVVESTARVTSETIAMIGWISNEVFWIRYFVLGSSPKEVQETFRLERQQWRSIATRSFPVSPVGSATSGTLRIQVLEGLNVPPDIAAEDLRTRCQKRITELNPQLRSKQLGIVEVFEWTDSLGRRFKGGLALPPNYDSSRRYPIVIQGGGFYPDTFMVDGPTDSHSPLAARALANRDILVLQIPDERLPRGERENAPREATEAATQSETDLYLLEIEAAIEALDSAGKIDIQRIGLMGFSRIGMRMHYAVTFSKYQIAAATVADSISLTPYCYSLFYGRSWGGGMDTFDTLPQGSSIGAPLWGDGVKQWERKSYLFNLDRIRTPIRYEEYGTYQIGCSWELFANLKRHGRPVEMIHIPRGEHVLRAPWHLLTSKGGNVDWFDFWLNGREDLAEDKREQYARWRRLRVQHEGASPERQTSAAFK